MTEWVLLSHNQNKFASIVPSCTIIHDKLLIEICDVAPWGCVCAHALAEVHLYQYHTSYKHVNVQTLCVSKRRWRQKAVAEMVPDIHAADKWRRKWFRAFICVLFVSVRIWQESGRQSNSFIQPMSTINSPIVTSSPGCNPHSFNRISVLSTSVSNPMWLADHWLPISSLFFAPRPSAENRQEREFTF